MDMLEDAMWLTGVIMFGTRAWDMWHGQSSELGSRLIRSSSKAHSVMWRHRTVKARLLGS